MGKLIQATLSVFSNDYIILPVVTTHRIRLQPICVIMIVLLTIEFFRLSEVLHHGVNLNREAISCTIQKYAHLVSQRNRAGHKDKSLDDNENGSLRIEALPGIRAWSCIKSVCPRSYILGLNTQQINAHITLIHTELETKQQKL